MPTLIVSNESTYVFKLLDDPDHDESGYAIAMYSVIDEKLAYEEIFSSDATEGDENPIDRIKFVTEEVRYRHCQALVKTIAIPKSHFYYDRDGYLSRQSWLDTKLQKFVPCLIRVLVL